MRKGWCHRSIEVLSDDPLKGVLKTFDKNGDGKLSRKELKVGLKSLGLRFAGFRAWRAVRRADANGDGQIGDEEMDELAKYVSKWGLSISTY
ncbi:hypothetical protein OSB04_003605 [Centaurea solstitialis]|uniref:EF-hand domain-containing protein n=1 Tax=Centaurea solstitialis TaxID=347529 RepID=A0AA38TWZ6_9ASTR|nr:hypothetical protein OSB04_003605 [Centaurea solstitialis]